MFAPKRFLQCGLLMLPLLLFVAHGNAQFAMNLTVGESHLFDVKPELGITYCWRVWDHIDQLKGKEAEKVIYLTSQGGPSVSLKWEKAGIFYLEVTGVNQNGCSNRKIFQVNVMEKHAPIAINDYASTTWLESVVINLLSNDLDAGNDIATSSLTILTKPEYGEVRSGPNGSITYTPLQKQPGTVVFQYKICDSFNDCDTAKVSVDVQDPPLFLPQGISPNGDGINDKFVLNGLAAFPKSSLTIFSRDGIIVFKTNDYQNDWEGTYSVENHDIKRLPPGTYYYLLLPGGTNHIIKGFVYLTE